MQSRCVQRRKPRTHLLLDVHPWRSSCPQKYYYDAELQRCDPAYRADDRNVHPGQLSSETKTTVHANLEPRLAHVRGPWVWSVLQAVPTHYYDPKR